MESSSIPLTPFSKAESEASSPAKKSGKKGVNVSQSNHRIQSYVFVGVQFICLGWIFATGPWVAKTPVLFLIEMLGGFLGVWALVTMKLRHLSALPEIKVRSPLQTGGPYRWIRHPMYTAVLLLTLALVIEECSFLRGGV